MEQIITKTIIVTEDGRRFTNIMDKAVKDNAEFVSFRSRHYRRAKKALGKCEILYTLRSKDKVTDAPLKDDGQIYVPKNVKYYNS